MSDAARRDEVVLSDADEALLTSALDRLRAAVKAYERFTYGDAQTHDAGEMRAAQEAVQAAEDELWRLRENLLGWARPSWAPSATMTADWFSDEDSVYDDLTEPTSP